MKTHRLNPLIGLCALLLPLITQAQLPNGDFETNCGGNSGGCPTFSSGCIPGWFVSHGTPQLLTGGGFGGTNASVLMWSHANVGEGIGVDLDAPLISGEQYQLCFAYRTSNPEGLSPATIFVRLTNGLAYSSGGCGDPVPFALSQQIHTISILPGTTGWTSASITFTPGANYNQVNVYPHTAAVAASDPATIVVDHFLLVGPIGQCTSTLTIDQTSSSVSGTFDNWGAIRAGSHVNGSSTSAYVTVDQPGLTTFAAAQFVSLEDNFLALPGADDEAFLAMIEPCTTSCRFALPRSGDPIPSFPVNEDFRYNRTTATMDVFPNPAQDRVTVRATNGLANAVLMDVAGRIARTFGPQAGERSSTFSLQGLKPGIYFLHLTDNSGSTEVKKLVIEN